jgi:hypothetical protein
LSFLSLLFILCLVSTTATSFLFFTLPNPILRLAVLYTLLSFGKFLCDLGSHLASRTRLIPFTIHAGHLIRTGDKNLKIGKLN